MNWLKKKVIKWVREDWENENKKLRRYPDEAVCTPNIDIDTERGLDIKVSHAIGGTIVTFRNYNRQQDRYVNSVYIVNEGEQLGEAIGKLITQESLRL